MRGTAVLAVMTSVVGADTVPTRTVVELTTVLVIAGGVLALVGSLAFTYVPFTGGFPTRAPAPPDCSRRLATPRTG